MAGLIGNLLKKKAQNTEDENEEMGFLDHLEELRWHVVRSILAIVICTCLALIFQTWVFENIIYAPKKPDFITYRFFCNISPSVCFTPPDMQLITRELGEQFFVGLTVCIWMGFIAAFPYVFYEFWSFIKPGLYDKEQKVANRLVGVTSMLFLVGILFGYYIIAPFAISYLGSYTVGTEATTSPSLASYVNYLTMFCLPTGIAFELPIVIYFLAKIGIVGPKFMRAYRREAYLVILVVAAIITPPDVVTQCLVAFPVFLLYEASIYIAYRVEKENALPPADTTLPAKS
jgi:sec-independent protein translocase protein TatC